MSPMFVHVIARRSPGEYFPKTIQVNLTEKNSILARNGNGNENFFKNQFHEKIVGPFLFSRSSRFQEKENTDLITFYLLVLPQL